MLWLHLLFPSWKNPLGKCFGCISFFLPGKIRWANALAASPFFFLEKSAGRYSNASLLEVLLLGGNAGLCPGFHDRMLLLPDGHATQRGREAVKPVPGWEPGCWGGGGGEMGEKGKFSRGVPAQKRSHDFESTFWSLRYALFLRGKLRLSVSESVGPGGWCPKHPPFQPTSR